MIDAIKKKLNKYPGTKSFIKSPFNWLYCAFLTLRYVDDWNKFPAFIINGKVRLRISKLKGAKFKIQQHLILEQWLFGDEGIVISLSRGGQCIIENDFVIGNGVRIFVAPAAKLVLKGKDEESASGITANSIIMVYRFMEIGKDCIISWDTFLTDCDWHGIHGKTAIADTIIGDHVWIGVGAKVLKGAIIGQNSIITSLSVVLKGNYPESSLISGNPGKIVKSDIAAWTREMFT